MEIGKVNGGVKGVGMGRFWCFVLECGIVEEKMIGKGGDKMESVVRDRG